MLLLFSPILKRRRFLHQVMHARTSPLFPHAVEGFQVSAAVAQVGDPAKVWEKNVETTRALGADAMRSRIEACIARPPSTPPPISVELPRGDEEEGRER